MATGTTRNGAVRISAQQITCQPPQGRLSAPPSAYPRPPRATAPSTSTSAASIPLTPCVAAKASTASTPAAAAAQNARGGRSSARATAHAAVAAGSTPTTTLVCAELRCLSAIELSSGKPTTTPSPTSAKRGRSARAGTRSRRTASSAAASTAATRARPRPTNVGSRSRTATRVAGSENENPTTPTKPQITAACVTAGARVALLTVLMPNDNAASAVIATLEAEIARAAPGTRLPSVRELMARHRAGPATVQRAIAVLAARGLVEARPGRGTFVAAGPATAVAADLSWQAVPLGARVIDADALEALQQPAPAGTI